MWIYKLLNIGTDILLAMLAVKLLILYFDIFFLHSSDRHYAKYVYALFLGWQLIISNITIFPAYLNISITVAITLLTSLALYQGNFWNKCVFTIAFNAIWMLMETLCGYVFMSYFESYMTPKILGSFISKILFLFIILALRKVFTIDEIKELPANYSIILVLIPTGSIYIMNHIFMLSSKTNSTQIELSSLIAALMLLSINILIFYIYLKLTDELQLKRCNSVYEQQLELCERHQQERELSMLQFRDARHNMKNNLILILAYAQNKNYEKIINFIEDIMESGDIKSSSVSNTGNIVIDSLINYWFSVAQRQGISFSVKLYIPMKMPFKGADISLILGNLLENALEAAQKTTSEKYIRLSMKYDKNNLLIFASNSYNGHLLKTKDGQLKSTKENSFHHGIGLGSIYRTVQKYNGSMIIDDSSNKEFLLKILLYAPKNI